MFSFVPYAIIVLIIVVAHMARKENENISEQKIRNQIIGVSLLIVAITALPKFFTFLQQFETLLYALLLGVFFAIMRSNRKLSKTTPQALEASKELQTQSVSSQTQTNTTPGVTQPATQQTTAYSPLAFVVGTILLSILIVIFLSLK